MSMEVPESAEKNEFVQPPEVRWQTVEYSIAELIDDPRLSSDEQRRFLWYLETFGPDTIMRQHIPNRFDVAHVTEILSPSQAMKKPIGNEQEQQN